MEIKNIEGLKVSQIKHLVSQGAKFVIFPYTISFIVMTLKRSSSIYFIQPNENTIKYSWGHTGLNLVMGWWGLPWGPIYTIGATYHHIRGGKNITPEVMSHLIQNDPDADTSTYNININNSNSTTNSGSAYNIPR